MRALFAYQVLCLAKKEMVPEIPDGHADSRLQ